VNQPSDDLLKRAARAAWWNAVVTPASAAVSFVGSLWIIRSLAKEDFGFYVLVIAFSGGLSTFADLGTSRAAARLYPDLRRAQGRRGVFRLLFIQTGLKTCLVVLFGAAAFLLGQRLSGRLTVPAELLQRPTWALVVFIALISSLRDSLRACWSGLLEQFIPNLVHFVASVLRPVLVVVLYRHGGVGGALVGMAAAATVRVLMLAIPLAWWRGPQPAGGAVGHLGRRMGKLSAMSYVDKMGTFLTGTGFLVLIGARHWSPEEIAGIWAALDITIRAITLALSVSAGILVPAFAEVAGKDRSVHRATGYSFAMRMHAALATAAGAAFAVGARSAIPILCRDAYAASGGWAAVAAVFMALHFGLFPPPNAVLVVSERFRGYLLARSVSLLAIPVYAAASLGTPLAGIVALGGLHGLETVGVLVGSRLVVGVTPPWGKLLRVGMVWAAVLLIFSLTFLSRLWWPLRMGLAFASCLAGVACSGVFQREEIRTALSHAIPRFDRFRWFRRAKGGL
jgi:O-antigen/teichoic acid export membrane protein